MNETLQILQQALSAIGPDAPLSTNLPSLDRFGRPVPIRMITRAERELVLIAGGGTTVRGRGGWVNRAGRLVWERVRVVLTCFPDPLTPDLRARLERCLFRVLVEMDQEALTIMVGWRMFFIPRPDDMGDGGRPVTRQPETELASDPRTAPAVPGYSPVPAPVQADSSPGTGSVHGCPGVPSFPIGGGSKNEAS